MVTEFDHEFKNWKEAKLITVYTVYTGDKRPLHLKVVFVTATKESQFASWIIGITSFVPVLLKYIKLLKTLLHHTCHMYGNWRGRLKLFRTIVNNFAVESTNNTKSDPRKLKVCVCVYICVCFCVCFTHYYSLVCSWSSPDLVISSKNTSFIFWFVYCSGKKNCQLFIVLVVTRDDV